MSKSWDSSILKKLKALTGKGLSTAEIGKRLGISKNAVVGKLHRLGWNVKAGGVATDDDKVKTKKAPAKKTAVKSEPVKKVAASKKPAAKTPAKKTVAKSEPVKKVAEKTPVKKSVGGGKKTTNVHQRIVQHALEMMDLKPGQCRWPIGDPDSEDFHFCGKSVFVGKPYCYEHCKQAYQFTAPKKKN